MKKIEQLTPEQEVLMAQTAEKWINIGLSTERLDEGEMTKSIHWVYEFCDLEKPDVVILDSPMAVQLLGNELLASKQDRVRDLVWDRVGDRVRDRVRDLVWDRVWDLVWDRVRDRVRDLVWDRVRVRVWDRVWDRVWVRVRVPVGVRVRDRVGARVRVREFLWDYYCDISDGGWTSFYDFFESAGVFDDDKDLKEMFTQWRKLAEQAPFMSCMFDGVALISEKPISYSFDDQGRLHNTEKMAVEFADGYGEYFIHGVAFEEELFNKFKSGEFKALDVITHKNQDQKRALAMAYGNERLVEELGAREVAVQKDNAGYDMRILLIEDQEEPIVFYEAVDPSKGEKIYIRIPEFFQEGRTPYEAKIWTFKRLWEEYEATGVLPEFSVES